MRLGVVSLAEKFGGVDVTDKTFASMTAYVSDSLEPFVAKVADETPLRPVSSARHLGHRDDHRGRAPQFAPI